MNTSEKRTLGKRNSIGQLIALGPEFIAIREAAEEALARGASDEEVTALIVQMGRDEGLIGPRVLLPSLTRKLLRMPAAKVWREIADFLTKKTEGQRLGDVADGLWGRLGLDREFAAYFLHWAKTGEPGAYFESWGGKVWTQKMGFGDSKGAVGGISKIRYSLELTRFR